jgi:biotin operon repressor
MNSQRVRNLGKPASMVLGLLMEKPHSRQEITKLLGYSSRNGASRVLHRLKHEKKLIDSDNNGIYSLAEGFFDLLQEEIRANNEDIEVLKDRHQVQTDDFN